LIAKGGNRRILCRELPGNRVIGGNRHEGCAIKRVGACGVDLDLGRTASGLRIGDLPAQRQTLRFANPVLLHQPYLFGPLIQLVQRLQQILGEIRNPEEPLCQLALLHKCSRPPAATVDDLLIGEHGHVDRVPVDLGIAAVDQSRSEKIEKQRLLLLVIIDIAGGEFATPVERQSHGLELFAHGIDVGVGPFARMDLVLDCGILCRHSESIPTHRMQHIEATGALVAGDNITKRIVAHMAHMDPARRVGKHFEHIIFRIRTGIVRLVYLCFVPTTLPAAFRLFGIVPFNCHVRSPETRRIWPRPSP
jgi:hypothetical protein